MSLELSNRSRRSPYVEDDDMIVFHEESGKIIMILFVPSKPEQRNELRALVDDGRVLERSKIKHSNRSISTGRCKYIG